MTAMPVVLRSRHRWRWIRRTVARLVAVGVFTMLAFWLQARSGAWSYAALALAIVIALLVAIAVFWMVDALLARGAAWFERRRYLGQ
ncbi:hypothetical protein [Mitsuaria sp. GD03876]|uniref:hypothetical protein n=1 Tax=Mitsuaria sp. GD03876 TaxID=2975399 RepID=UPI002448D15A|nr:hypothetical protein [Mitsuaria sp. GD03876]MDH0867369.1 hypothetical protein [Mitsuaria sp. GD03876]